LRGRALLNFLQGQYYRIFYTSPMSIPDLKLGGKDDSQID
jgi:hypothetical protein